MNRLPLELATVLLTICLAILSVSPVLGASNEVRLLAQPEGWVPPGIGVERASAGRQTGTQSVQGYTGCGGSYAPLVNGDYEQQVVELVNAARAGQSPPLPPLKRVASLDASARFHAADMGGENFFAHNSFDRVDGSLVEVCPWYDRLGFYYNGGYKGENIAGGFATPRDAVNAWLNSPSHRANILSANYREIGVGYYEGSGTYLRYWVQDFGQRTGEYPLIVNGEAVQTDSRTVELYVYGDWQEMRLRNDDGEWGPWEPFRTSSTWTLDGGMGYHTVYAELRSGAAVASSSDTIYLNANTAVLANVPETVAFVYSIPDGRLSPLVAQVMPLNVGDNTILSWNVAGSGAWFTVSPTQGATPDPFQIRPNGATMDTPALYTGRVTVTAVSGVGVGGSPRPIDLTLRVINSPIRSVYLPTVMQRASP